MDALAIDSRNAGPIQRARGLAGLVKAASTAIEHRRELTPEVLAALHEARLFRLLLPRSAGGEQIDLATMTEITCIIAAADASTAWCLGQGGGCAMTAAMLAPSPAKRLFGAADSVLAWGAGVQGTAIETTGGYRVSGRWSFASGSRHATMLGAHCKVIGSDGKPKLRPSGRQLDLTALLPRARAEVHDVWQVVGLKGTGSDTYEVRDLFVAADETADRDDLDAVRVPGTLYKFPQGMAYSASFGGVTLGIARGMLDDLKALAMAKTARGAASSMRQSEAFQADLGRLEGRWRAAWALHISTVRRVWDDVDAGQQLGLDHRIDWRLAATHAINEGCQVTVDAYRAAGQNAIFENAPFEHRLRDALSAAQQVQGRPTHYITAGRHFLGLEPDTTMFL